MKAPLETFPNPEPARDFLIRHLAEEFTSVCPKTGHPDFAQVLLSYIPAKTCLELKAYKIYLQGFRNEGIFYEAVTNRILADLAEACTPKWMRIETIWTGRGGIRSVLHAEYPTEGYTPTIQVPPLVTLP
ncbi:MAG: preQ(1) synthase [Opitutales bacterium]